MPKRPKPTRLNKSYRIFDYEKEGAQVVSHCIGCGWESHPLECIVDGETTLDQIRSITSFNKGYLAGAFSNHICGADPGDGVAEFKYPAG